LPPLGHARPLLEEPFVAPQTPLAQQVAAIWCALLGLDEVGMHDNFFEVGGHSLLAIQLLSLVRDALQVEVSLLSLFEAPTVAGLSTRIEAAMTEAEGRPVLFLERVSRERPLPASIAQEQLWQFDRLLTGLPLFNLSYAVWLAGALDVAALRDAF